MQTGEIMKAVKNSVRLIWSLSWVLGIGLIAAWAIPLQGNSNHQQTGPQASSIKQGYAVITPTSTETSGLVAFETFGERRGFDVEQAGVLPSTMTTHSALFVNASGRLSRNVGVAIANPAPTPATITLNLRDNAGKNVGTTSFSLASHQQTARFVTQLFASQSAVPRDLTGTLDISSNVPIAVVGLRFRGLNFSTEPATVLAPPSGVPVISPSIGGPASVILAHFATGGGWASEIVMANVGSIAITVRVDLFATDGTPLTATLNGQTNSSFIGITIPAGGVVTLAPLDADGDSDF
jgi:hypothetical protein